MKIVSEDPSIPQLHPGDTLKGWSYEERLQPLSPSARVIAHFESGEPAIVASTYGKGKSITVGSFLGALYEAERDPNVAKFLDGLMDWAGVSRPVEVSRSPTDVPIEVRTMESGKDTLVFIFNHSISSRATPVIGIKVKPGVYQMTNLVKQGPQIMPADHKETSKIALSKDMKPQEVWVVKLSRQ